MESGLNWEYMALINELTQGVQEAKQLRSHLCSVSSPSQTEDLLLQRIVSSFEKALVILKWKESMVGQASGAPESSISVAGSAGSDELNRSLREQQDYNTSKKRKHQPTWTEQVKVNSDNGLEGPIDDGYSWRKYGQKDILGANHPRSYYRCTYRALRNCWATKQVQRSDADPSVFDITYKGTHSCNQSTSGIAPPASQEKQVQHITYDYHPQQQNQTLMTLKANLRVSTENLDNSREMPNGFSFQSTLDGVDNPYFPVNNLADDNNFGGGYGPLFVSPATSESNYFSPATYGMENFGGNTIFQHSESDNVEIISAHASTTNSPIGGIEFPYDSLDLCTNFPYNTLGFLPTN